MLPLHKDRGERTAEISVHQWVGLCKYLRKMYLCQVKYTHGSGGEVTAQRYLFTVG